MEEGGPKSVFGGLGTAGRRAEGRRHEMKHGLADSVEDETDTHSRREEHGEPGNIAEFRL
ncbi:hypothetical protein SDC9_58712 [bioreactor metagenome]|uniref:Uncharacterized protein n=1 Tax=bioreactor metagenome TaxID=1076179 RepID=A0A644X8G5_9ZZZZ